MVYNGFTIIIQLFGINTKCCSSDSYNQCHRGRGLGSTLERTRNSLVANCRLQGTKRALIRNTKVGAKVAVFAFSFCISVRVHSPLLITVWRSYRGLCSLKKRNNIAYIVYYRVEQNHQTFVLWLFFSFMLSLHILI